ncbi:MAG: TIGR03663 family protein, partial [Cyclobacteriaceae bacterium]|nr:TIGR03663 family protein [Cyclobacteriaceae bacterium]
MNKWFVLFFIIAGLALMVRLVSLEIRPMHTDEAVHAVKFGRLLEEGYYRYDKNEYHGPLLNYLTLIPAWFLSQKDLAGVNEYTLRVIPAISGTGLVLLLLAVIRFLKSVTWIFSALFLGISPVLVFYSRYYIQESLLVFFTWAALFFLYRWIESGNKKWALLTGFTLGMTVATKETWIIALGGILFSAMVLFFTGRKTGIFPMARALNLKNMGLMMLSAAIVWILFYSSFFSNLQGLTDSMATYANYIKKAGGFEKHIHPWYYYLQLLAYGRNGGWFWTEAFLLAAGSIGFIFALRNRNDKEGIFFLFIALFSIFTACVYSMLPYKTPWNLLTSYTGWILLAGYGCAEVIRISRTKTSRYLICFLIFSGVIHLGYQTWFLNYEYYADASNPWVYGHTGRDIFRLVEKVEDISGTQPSGKDIHIEIIAAGHDYWPLPWYFREYPNTGWWDHVDMVSPPAPVIIASPEFGTELLEKIYEIP